MFGLAQMLATVSPKMFKEFEVDYANQICERFGLVYYGCCDSLHDRMDQVRMIPNVRKISMSPWVDQARGRNILFFPNIRESRINFSSYVRMVDPPISNSLPIASSSSSTPTRYLITSLREIGCACVLALFGIKNMGVFLTRFDRIS